MLRRRNPPAEPDPVPAVQDDIYEVLRTQALGLEPEPVPRATDHDLPNVFGVVMDIGYPEGTATLVALADGTTSLYTSTGGGTIGAGSHAQVATATHTLLRTAEATLDAFPPSQDSQLPPAEHTAITLLTYSGRRRSEAATDDLGHNRSPASRVFHAAHEVIHHLNQV